VTMAPPKAKQVVPLQAYNRHIISEHLKDRHPYLEDIRGHLKVDEVSTAQGERLFPRLVELLSMPSIAPEKLVEALHTICDLCSHQESKTVAISSDVIAAATHLLMHESVPVRRAAARVISSMALLIGGRSLLPIGSSPLGDRLVEQSGPALPRLAKLLLSCDDELVKLHVAEAFQAITIFRDGCQQVVDQSSVLGITQYMCGTLPDLPSSRPLALCLLRLLQTMAAVTMYARDGMRDIFSTGFGLIGKVVKFLENVPIDKPMPSIDVELSTNIVRQALRLLWHCGNSAQGRVETLQADGAHCITQFLSHNDAKVREAAVCALNVISLETRGKKDILQHSLDAIARIIHSESETTYLHETCVQLCRCAAELPAFRFAFARHVLKSIWLLQKVFGTTSLAAISPLLSSKEDMEIRIQAAVVAEHFLTSQEPLLGDDIRVPPVCPLVNVEQPPAFGFEECVDILQHLVELIEQTPSAQVCLKALVRRERPRQELAKLIRSGLLVVPANQQSFVESLAAEDQSQAKAFAKEELIESFKQRQGMRYLVALQMATDAQLEEKDIPCVYSLHKMKDTFLVPESSGNISCQLCFILDYTAHMKTQISQAKESISMITDAIKNLRLAAAPNATVDLEMTAVAYTDWDADSAKLGRPVVAAFGGKEIKCSHTNLTPADFNLEGKFTKDASALRSWMDQSLGHGGQIPEELTGAMLAASYLPWTAQEKLVVIVTDAPCHGKEYSSVVHDPFCDPTTGLTCTGKPEVPLRSLMEKGVRVVVLHTGEAHAVSMCSRLQDTDPRLIHEKVNPLETAQKLVSVVESKLQLQPLHYVLKPYRLDQGEFLSPLELALDHDVEIEEAGAKEKCNTGTDGLLFLGNRLNPKITIGRPSDSSLDAWFNRKSDQVELPQAFDGQKTYLLKMPANK